MELTLVQTSLTPSSYTSLSTSQGELFLDYMGQSAIEGMNLITVHQNDTDWVCMSQFRLL